jgi:hypothetical protein
MRALADRPASSGGDPFVDGSKIPGEWTDVLRCSR